ncbi:MAG TPA: glycosyltransferase, partial [Opitutaceae bacterium]|nr:glycosyltransferase [Opitutaceae bacterium]
MSPPGSPSISLVTPSFNQASFLAASLDSVLSQNYPQLDYVVVDGGSTDGSRDIVASRASRLAWWCSEPD